MHNKLLSMIGIAALMIPLLVGTLPAIAEPAPGDYRAVDVGPQIRQWGTTSETIKLYAPEEQGEGLAQVQQAGIQNTDCIIANRIWLILNDYLGQYQATYFNLVAEGPRTQIWVQANLAWPAGDPRTTPVITCEQAQYLLGEFENNIYPVETEFFAAPDLHDGSYAYLPSLLGLPADYYYDASGRQVVLVSNIRDENYYDSTQQDYTTGFYTPTFEAYFDRNVITIDAYDWVNRLGPDAEYPYFYEGVFAHDYQHLLHDDFDSDDESFVDQGLADLAVFLTGYGKSLADTLRFTAAHPKNSLVLWGDQGVQEIQADYGQAFLFQLYLYEQFGREFIKAEFVSPLNGISALDATLLAFGVNMTFADVYRNYSVAGLIDDPKFAGGRFGFKGLDFKFNIGTPVDPNPEASDTLGVHPWGTDFIWLNPTDLKNVTKLLFDGQEYTTFPTAWTVQDGKLWSGTGDLVDNWAIFETVGGGTLSFDTTWDLEESWDFGFVQVSTDGGHTWTSLPDNEGYSTDNHHPSAYEKVVVNMPGLTSSITDAVTLTYDLSAYAGQNILIAFRLVTDWATHSGGWWIDNVSVDDTLIFDGTDASVFRDITGFLPIYHDFMVTFVSMADKKRGNPYQVLKMNLGETGGLDGDGLQSLKALLSSSKQAVMLVTLDAPEGFANYTPYTYDFLSKDKGSKK